MVLRFTAWSERIHSSLFFEPLLFVLGAVALGVLGPELDELVVENQRDLPFTLTSTVDSARSVLSTVAGATITVAGIAFSISLLIIQLASSQYSPRVVPGLFRDPFNKRVMGIVVGTFTYCLVVLRAVRGALEDGGEPVIPNVSVAFAAFLGVVSILAIIAFIDHNAHSMDVSKILHDVTGRAVDTVRSQWRHPDEDGPDRASFVPPPTDVLVIDVDEPGWLQHIDHAGLARAADRGGTVRLETAVGRYAVAGTPLCTVWPCPEDPDRARHRARSSVVFGETRTSPQDVGYGVRQLADVALKALSPGINDPTTAQDAMFHLGTVLHELMTRRPPPTRQAYPHDRSLVLSEEQTHDELVELAFDEVRMASVTMPTFSIYLLELIHLLLRSLGDADLAVSGDALRRQARLVRDGVEAAEIVLQEDRRRVSAAYRNRFDGDGDER